MHFLPSPDRYQSDIFKANRPQEPTTSYYITFEQCETMAYHNSKDRLHRMVNNPYLADVKFLVGRKRKLIYAHRMLLTSSSEVFKAIFSKRFVKIHRNFPLVVVTDIEPDIFLDVLYFIYCDVCDIGRQNVAQLFYAAVRYQLYELRMRCEKFMIENTELGEWIQTFFSAPYPQLRDICAKQLSANIEEMFEHSAFLHLSSDQVREILDVQKLQCSYQELLTGANRWLEHQPESQRGEVVAFRWDLMRKIEDEERSRTEGYLMPYISGVILASRDLYLYGMGIYTGVKDLSADESCSVSVMIDVGCCEQTVIRTSIPLRLTNDDGGNERRTQDCHFERIRMSQGEVIKLTVRITGMDAELREAWCSSNRNRSADIGGRDVRIVSSDNARFVSPIAHLMYDIV